MCFNVASEAGIEKKGKKKKLEIGEIAWMILDIAGAVVKHGPL